MNRISEIETRVIGDDPGNKGTLYQITIQTVITDHEIQRNLSLSMETSLLSVIHKDFDKHVSTMFPEDSDAYIRLIRLADNIRGQIITNY